MQHLFEAPAVGSTVPATSRACRVLAAGIIVFIFLANLLFLLPPCSIDLAEDEAYYWDWSRQLDLSYYSKGPLVAWIIRASCALLGDSAMAVRLPALVFSAGAGILVYWLALRLLRSDRIALGALLLLHLLPISAARSIIMTIDPPLLLCWALATCFGFLATFENRRWAWSAMGVGVGLGLLAKLSMAVWLLGFGVWLLIDSPSRGFVRTRRPWLALLIAVAFTAPMVIWNWRHGWVTVSHVGENIGLRSAGGFSLANVIDFWAGQLAVIGPVMFILLLAATLSASRVAARDPDARRLRFLLCIGLPMLTVVFLDSFRTNPAANWPAPAYFTLVIVTACMVGRNLPGSRVWRVGLISAVAINLPLILLAYNTQLLYPLHARMSQHLAWLPEAREIDPAARLYGWAELADEISRELSRVEKAAFVLTDSYQTAAEMAFYLPGRPRTYYAGSYIADPDHRKALTQYDMWPDRALDEPGLRGRSAIYIGGMTDDVLAAFASVERLSPIEIRRRGVLLRTFTVWRCSGFRGMSRPASGAVY